MSKKIEAIQTTTSIVVQIVTMTDGLFTNGSCIVHSSNNASLHAGGWQKGYVDGWKSSIL